jgi:hypothetical protein
MASTSSSGDRRPEWRGEITDGLTVLELNPEHEMPHPSTQKVYCTLDSGYRGFWHGQTPTGDEYAYKYSGGLGTYCAKHAPFSQYAADVERTYFCWGGTPEGGHLNRDVSSNSASALFTPGLLYHMVSYYDHRTGTVPRPTIIMDKQCGDAHDNPVISVDEDGYIWVFSPSHGPWTTPSYVHRSVRPHDISTFVTTRTALYAYPQVHRIDSAFQVFHTLYTNGGRTICFSRISGEPRFVNTRVLAHVGQGHYQVSDARDGRIVTAFNYHPVEGGLEARTNLYVMTSDDGGDTWAGPNGEPLSLPMRTIDHPARLLDYEDDGWLVYMKDVRLDQNGDPIILFVRSRGNLPGPANGPRVWTTAVRQRNGQWIVTEVARSDSNYDTGSLFLEDPERWLIAGPTDPGPQRFNPGGEIALWESMDRGQSWRRVRAVTSGSRLNHTYLRRTRDYGRDFAAFWADGNPREPSESNLYFADSTFERVRRLPQRMDADAAVPEEMRF